MRSPCSSFRARGKSSAAAGPCLEHAASPLTILERVRRSGVHGKLRDQLQSAAFHTVME